MDGYFSEPRFGSALKTGSRLILKHIQNTHCRLPRMSVITAEQNGKIIVIVLFTVRLRALAYTHFSRVKMESVFLLREHLKGNRKIPYCMGQRSHTDDVCPGCCIPGKGFFINAPGNLDRHAIAQPRLC